MRVKNFVFGGFAAAVLLSAGVTSANAATALASKEYVDNSVKDMVTGDTLNTTLENYVDNSTLSTTLEEYATKDDLEDLDFVDQDALDEALDKYQLKLTSTGDAANVKTEGANGVLHTVVAADGTATFTRGYVTNDDIADGTISQGKIDGLTTVVQNVTNLGNTINNIITEEGDLQDGIVGESNLDAGLANKIDGKQDKSTAAYQFGGENGTWQAMTTEEKAAIQSGVTKAIVDGLGTAELTTTAKTLREAINELKTKTEGLPTDENFEEINSKISELEGRVDDLEEAVGDGPLNAGQAKDIIEAINSIYADLSGKVDKKQSVNNGILTTDATGNVTVSTTASVATSIKDSLNLNEIATWAGEECDADSKLCVLSFNGSDLHWTDVTKDQPDVTKD